MTKVIDISNDYAYHEFGTSVENNVTGYVNHSLSYNEYFRRYLQNNIPCVIQSATDAWPCRQMWQADNAPNFEYIKRVFGSCIAPVADCTAKYYNSQLKDDMALADYVDYWITYRDLSDPKNMPLLYLKDWHCVKNNPHIPIYNVPQYFASDWLNEYYTEQEELNDDYMFIYMGPKGTWTPFHADVFSSYSWSANIVGKKRWLLFAPGDEESLRDKHGKLIYDITTSNELLNQTMYPNYDEDRLKRYEIIQQPGEIVFIPSGWHHQVWNLEDTISINHNWINACNVWNVWISLKKELCAVMREVEDCRDMDGWDDHCQLMLKASHGMDYVQFYKFLSFLSKKRMALIMKDTPVISFHTWYLGRNHCFYDLKQIRLVLDDMIRDVEEKCIHSLIFSENEARFLVDEINKILAVNPSFGD
ncbi:2-oxoglutarate and iron-dependent oxygenase JMJD4 [Neodiprion pinetum]|uniref:Jumonji domain-containing protein 4 n=1 Tax=Neodiprion lecontei TaxID=441921 RepID=A0A6J0BLR5_NEOLC|nr:2-oxoglutarate and iron-dependent oxygenase JMJD4 [Neodiprion lecontei]XP_046466861.1 2-oxoglutarate and iron-dependent oxygenase JMJD4 [Neodiprion pinetum]